jgi:hypothetical protein
LPRATTFAFEPANSTRAGAALAKPRARRDVDDGQRDLGSVAAGDDERRGLARSGYEFGLARELAVRARDAVLEADECCYGAARGDRLQRVGADDSQGRRALRLRHEQSRERTAVGPDLLARGCERQHAHAGAAAVLGDRHREQAELGESVELVAREVAVLVALLRGRSDRVLHELGDRVEDEDLVVGELQVVHRLRAQRDQRAPCQK